MTYAAVSRSARRCATGAALAFLAIFAVGCFTADVTLNADGSGTADITYGVLPNAKVDVEKARWSSPHVTLKSFTPKPNNTAVVQVAFDDVTKLSTADGFRQVKELTRTREGDVEHIKLVISNPKPVKDLKDEGRPGIHLAVTLPGPVKEANRGAKIDGNHVTWDISLYDYLRAPSTELTVTYAVSGTAGEQKAPGADAAPKEPSEKKSGD